MAQKIIDLPGIGEVMLAKRRGTKNLRLSILPDGKVRVCLPAWAPYAAGIKFALSREDWIRRHIQNRQPLVLKHGHLIGKSYRLEFVSQPIFKRTSARLGINSIKITSSLDPLDLAVQKSAAKACERALRLDSEKLLSIRLNQLAAKHGFEYRGFRVKRLASRWGSCSSDGTITLNYFLIQLPWDLIDYVIIHELAHTRHLNHSSEFWGAVERIIPNAKHLRKQIKQYRPVLNPA